MTVTVKICGVTDAFTAQSVVAAGADMIGLVFFPRSPRFVTIEQAKEIVYYALSLTGEGRCPSGRPGEGVRNDVAPSPFPSLHDGTLPSPVRERVLLVGLFVDPTDDELDKTSKAVALDMIQLHGAESPARVAEIRSRYKLPVMKALPVGSAADLDAASAYEESCDWLLFDARPPAKAVLPGGNGVSFDWHLLAGRSWNRPWMLSGGLNPANVAEAIRISGAEAVDVSSGVETSPGIKNAGLVREFIDATLAP